MEKKLKINFILKGIAVFAFVAFCLLAILAGVTLPFVSNASTTDCAVASAEGDSLYIPLSQVQSNTVYYAISVPNDSVNINAPISSSVGLFNLTSNDSNDIFRLGATHIIDKNYVEMYIIKDGITYDYQYLFIANVTSSEFRYDAGFTFSDINSIHSTAFDLNILVRTAPFATDTDLENLENQVATLTAEKNALQIQVNNLTAEKATLQSQLTDKQNQIDTLTAEKATLQSQLTEKQNQIDTLTAEKATLQSQLTEKQNQIDTLIDEKNALQTQINNLIDENNNLKNSLGFKSRFGYIGSMPSSNLYLNLQEKPILPDSLRTIKDSNGNLVNGWTYHDNSYWLPLIIAYDGFGNPVDGGFTGWNVFNFQYNSAGELISQPQINFWFDNLTFTTDVNVNFVDGVLSVPDFTNVTYRYESNFSNSDNLLVYASLNKSYKYYLQPNITQNDVYKFFALIDYRNYKPLDNDFYVAGYNSASSGYYDTVYKNGYAVGNTDGYNNGFSAGDSKGYQRGLNDANNYTFLSLFGAIFDAPIQALFGGTQRLPAGTKITDSSGKTITLTSDTVVNRGGMLNFELMGVNLSGFVLALFSFSIIIIVIKFALAKK